MKHEAFYLPYWWQWLDQLALAKNGFDTFDIRCDGTSEKWVEPDRAVHISTERLFPGQHFIWTPVNLEKGGTGKMVALYRNEGAGGIHLNPDYITTWEKWRARQVSSENLVPDRLKLLFADPNGVIVDEEDIEAIGEAFLEAQVELFQHLMGWMPS